ncbi:MAG: hypothetical protein K9I99_13930 [Melioribacteraceae bacterium]|nr:hypothetical protein [Melioribacteraceae bacterium]
MKRYLYLSLMPEALVASMLPPEEFGNYLAVGTRKRTRGQAMFFEVDPDFESDWFNMEDIEKRCVPHSDGSPKRSKYLSIYRVLEHVPLEKLKNLYLVTDDGRVLGLKKGEYVASQQQKLHLYQQICPTTPRVASRFNAIDFVKNLTDTTQPVSVPKLVFIELKLDDLATDPINGSDNDLPYPNIDHLRDCLTKLDMDEDKPNKTVIRFMQRDLFYRTIKSGIFVGDQETFIHFPFPTKKELENEYYTWWRSALIVGFH